MKIITFSGVDGSGKSTQIDTVAKYLTHKKYAVYQFHAIEFSIAQKLLRGKNSNKESNSRNAVSIKDTGKSKSETSWFGVILRKIAFLIDIARFHLLKNKCRSNHYDFILSDRFYFDTVINIRSLSHKSSIGLLEHLMPRVDIPLFFSISPEKIMQRNRVPEQGIDYLHNKTNLFKERLCLWQMKEVDADKSPDDVSADVFHIIDTFID